jgi:hypothetical protein
VNTQHSTAEYREEILSGFWARHQLFFRSSSRSLSHSRAEILHYVQPHTHDTGEFVLDEIVVALSGCLNAHTHFSERVAGPTGCRKS